jgi:trimethylamine:corrinoid methyltransferase-like protein
MRDVTWFPGITNRQKWDAWMAEGGKDMRQHAIERARRILAGHHPVHLDEKAAEKLDRMAVAFQAQGIQAIRSGRVSY